MAQRQIAALRQSVVGIGLSLCHLDPTGTAAVASLERKLVAGSKSRYPSLAAPRLGEVTGELAGCLILPSEDSWTCENLRPTGNQEPA